MCEYTHHVYVRKWCAAVHAHPSWPDVDEAHVYVPTYDVPGRCYSLQVTIKTDRLAELKHQEPN